MTTRGDSLKSSADTPAVHALYMGRDAGAASFRDWKRAVDMKLSKRDDDLLYLVNHGERSALEEPVLRGKPVQDFANNWQLGRCPDRGARVRVSE